MLPQKSRSDSPLSARHCSEIPTYSVRTLNHCLSSPPDGTSACSGRCWPHKEPNGNRSHKKASLKSLSRQRLIHITAREHFVGAMHVCVRACVEQAEPTQRKEKMKPLWCTHSSCYSNPLISRLEPPAATPPGWRQCLPSSSQPRLLRAG